MSDDDGLLLVEINAIADQAAIEKLTSFDIYSYAAMFHEHFPDHSADEIVEKLKSAFHGRGLLWKGM